MQTDHRSSDPVAPPAVPRRLRLWQLPAASHALMIGLCLSSAELRRLTDRLFRGQTDLDDARLLAAVASECTTRNKVSDALQRTFDVRFVHTLTGFRHAKSPDALAALWDGCLATGQVGAGLWSASTHPCADEALHARMGRDVQMLQFDAVAARGADRRRLDELLIENGVLTREMARIQQRQTRWHAERRDEQAVLAEVRLELIRLRTDLAGRDRPAAVDVVKDDTVFRADTVARQRRAEQDRATVETPAWPPRRPTPLVEPPAAMSASAMPATNDSCDPVDTPVERTLVDAEGEARRILCVGGRTGHVPIYRALVEEQGAAFCTTTVGSRTTRNAWKHN